MRKLRAWLRGIEVVSQETSAESRAQKAQEIVERVEAALRRELEDCPERDLGSRLGLVYRLEEALVREFDPIEKGKERALQLLEGQRSAAATRYLEERQMEQPGDRLRNLVPGPDDPRIAAAGRRWYKRIRHDIRREAERTREHLILDAIRSGALRWSAPLPAELRYGRGLDERVVELPLALEVARLGVPGKVLDAGASLNQPYLRESFGHPVARVVHFTQSGEREWAHFAAGQVSYVFGDLRSLDFKDDLFDRIVCVSTLEHIGMDNSRYGGPVESNPESYKDALRELYRVLAPHGALLLTFPYGAAAQHGWYRTFSRRDIGEMRRLLRNAEFRDRYFYYRDHWREGTADWGAEMAVDGGGEPGGEAGYTAVAVVRVRKPPASRRWALFRWLAPGLGWLGRQRDRAARS